MSKKKAEMRARRKLRVRRRVIGTAERPRLSVFRTARHMYAQVVDDAARQTLAAASTLEKEIASALAESKGNKKDQAARVGTSIANKCKQKGIEKVVFDRNGFLYHGRVTALAEAARKGGLKF